MKMNRILAKSSLALAIGAFSAGAVAGVHTVNAPGAITLANEIFGSGSQDTLVAIPVSTYAVANNAIAATQVATVKYTLDKGAVFGEDLSDIDKWAASNATLEFTFGSDPLTPVVVGGAGAPYAQDPGFTIVVDQGGAIGDNTVTFKITNTSGAPDNLIGVSYGQVRVKNLTSALARGVTNPQVRLGSEFRNVVSGATDTQQAVVVLRSQDGVELTGTPTSYAPSAPIDGRARIDVADTELSFTGAALGQIGPNASQDFDETNNVPYVNLGTLNVVRTTYNAGAGAEIVKKENGDDFDFQGSDQPVITLTSATSLAAYSSIYLRPGAAACDGTPTPSDFVGTPVTGDENSVSINLSGETTVELGAGYRVCAVAGGSTVIPEASTVTAFLDVTYFNPRYTNSEDTWEYGPILRNGCQVTLFNLPNVTAADKAFIRLTNVSEKPGAVRGFVWSEDGTRLDTGSQLVANLPAHATTVLHTSEGNPAGIFLGDVLADFGAVESGRHRLVIQGAFPACEALGLIRTPSGVLSNMTSTTYSGDSSRLGPQNNGTSNTSN